MNRAKSIRRVMLLCEDRIADVPAPDGKALALALLEVAAAHDRPECVAGEYASRRLDLVVDVREAGDTCEPKPSALSFNVHGRRLGRRV